MTGWTQGFVNVNGIEIHYHRTGGKKPVLLLLHGISDNGLCWTRVARALQDRYDVVMPDARGHGTSARVSGSLTVSILAEDAAAVIRGLGLEQPVVIWGHSMGAITAAALAARYPELVKALVLEDPPLDDAASPPLPEGFLDRVRQELLDFRRLPEPERLARAAAEHPGWDAAELGPWADSKAQVDLNVLGAFESIREAGWQAFFQALRCPGLLLTGDPEAGGIVAPTAARLAIQLWAGGEAVPNAGAGHSVHRDRYPEVMQVVEGFLRRVG